MVDKGIFFLPVGGIYDKAIITINCDDHYADMYLNHEHTYQEYGGDMSVDLDRNTKVAGEGLERW